MSTDGHIYADPGRLLEARFLETKQLQWLAANEAILRCDIPSRMIARIRERVRLQREAFEKGIIYLTPARKYETIRASKRVARATNSDNPKPQPD